MNPEMPVAMREDLREDHPEGIAFRSRGARRGLRNPVEVRLYHIARKTLSKPQVAEPFHTGEDADHYAMTRDDVRGWLNVACVDGDVLPDMGMLPPGCYYGMDVYPCLIRVQVVGDQDGGFVGGPMYFEFAAC
jgi:hypothetical protein